jgi:hypothetical protein
MNKFWQKFLQKVLLKVLVMIFLQKVSQMREYVLERKKVFVTLIALNALLIFVTVLLIEFSLFNAYPTSLDWLLINADVYIKVLMITLFITQIFTFLYFVWSLFGSNYYKTSGLVMKIVYLVGVMIKALFLTIMILIVSVMVYFFMGLLWIWIYIQGGM